MNKKEESYGSYERYSNETATLLLLIDLEQKLIDLRIQQEAIIAALEDKLVISSSNVESKKSSIKSKYKNSINELIKQKKLIAKNKNCDKDLKSYATSENAIYSKESIFISKCFSRLFDM